MRPRNRKEQAMFDLIAWDCLDDHSIVFKNPNQDRPPTPYTFYKVFAPSCSTQKVCEEGARNVALSAFSGNKRQKGMFILRIAALDIYNETVIDLLNRESGPLRLFDDPEKGTIVEKLNEEVAKDGQHLRHLIGICEDCRV